MSRSQHSRVLEGGTTLSHSTLDHPYCLSRAGVGNPLDHGTECPLGIGSTRDRRFKGKGAQGGLSGLKKASWKN